MLLEFIYSSLAEQLVNITSKDDPVIATVNAFVMYTELSGKCVVHAQYDPNVYLTNHTVLYLSQKIDNWSSPHSRENGNTETLFFAVTCFLNDSVSEKTKLFESVLLVYILNYSSFAL